MEHIRIPTYQEIEEFNLDKFIELMFVDQPRSPYNQLREFQKQVLRVANSHMHTIVAAPSQSGKSTCNLGFIIPTLFKPEGVALIVTNSESNAEELYEDFVKYVLGDEKIEKQMHKQKIQRDGKLGIPFKTLTKVDSRTKGEYIATTPMGAQFFFTTATESAVAGKSPDRLVLDEVAIWPNNVAKTVFAEVMARTGNSHGRILTQSTVRRSGSFLLTPSGDFEIRDNTFFGHLKRIEHLQNLYGTRGVEAALTYTYHVSENLKQHVPRAAMTKDEKKYHYWSIPMESPEELFFSSFFNRAKHVIVKDDLRNLVPSHMRGNESWWLSIDPGTICAASLVQYVPQFGKFIVHEEFQNKPKQTVYDFVRETMGFLSDNYADIYPNIRITGDVASRQGRGNDMTYKTLIEKATNRYMYTQSQRVEEGCELLKNYMNGTNTFFVLAHCKRAIFAFEKGLKYKKGPDGLPLNAYHKDGVYDHLVDTIRYALYNATRGNLPTQRPESVNLDIRTAY